MKSGHCLFFGVLIFQLGYVNAAVPVVELESDPLTNFHCVSQSVDSLYVSGASTSATDISHDSAFVYQAAFNPTTFSGSLKKYRVAFDGASDSIKIAAIPDWDAADLLTGSATANARPTPDSRHIYTSMQAANKSLLSTRFLWPELSQSQKASLNSSPVNGNDDQLGEKRLNYLRGARQYEWGNASGIFRSRDRILGAIVHSTPVFVGTPSARKQGEGYSNFYEANKTRKSVIYVGASDGMLHAFDAANGEELFAYIPQALFKNLNSLTIQGAKYRAFVDGGIAVAEARLGNQWKTILASGMGGGAQGLFAIDVTSPEQFDKGLDVLWEFTDGDDADIGNVFAAPLIAKFKIKSVKGVVSYRDFVVVAGGVNANRDDGIAKFNSQAPGALFLFAADKGKTEPWKIGSNYYKFVVPISDKTIANGLTAPALTLADDGAVAYIYVGDLQGNLWRFDFNGNAPWSNALGSSSVNPLFTAMDAGGRRQPITQKIQIVYAPNGAYLLLFGTGKFMEAADMDVARFMTQSFYGVLDSRDGKTVARNQLRERMLLSTTSVSGVLEIAGSDINYSVLNGDKGWYFDFLNGNKTGERSVSSARVDDENLSFNTLIPHTNPCHRHSGRTYMLNVLTGLPAYANLTVPLSNLSFLNAPIVMTMVPEKIPADALGKRRVKKKLELLDPVSNDKSTPEAIPPKVVTESTTLAGRLSWRELVNWVELRISSSKK